MDEIQVGSIVELGGSKYEVVIVGTHHETGVRYPLAVHALTFDGERYPGRREIKGDSTWASYKWMVVANGGKPDPKAKIIAKIKYLDEKFKRNQEIKKRQKEVDEALAFQTGNLSQEAAPYQDLTMEQIRAFYAQAYAGQVFTAPPTFTITGRR